MAAFDRSIFNADITSKMDDIRSNYLREDDSDAKAFAFTVADMFETLDGYDDDGPFLYTDGANDKGLDFIIQREDSFKFYQCKSIDLGANPDGKVFDATSVNELDEAIQFMVDPSAIRASKSVAAFKSMYRLNKEEHTLTAVLAIEGVLSDPAYERWRQIKETWEHKGINVELIDEQSLFDYWHGAESFTQPSSVELQLELQNKDAILKCNGWVYGVFNLGSFLRGMQKYGNALFDLNVRSNLNKSSVNEAIRKTISTVKGQKRFIHLNNGLVIVCDSHTLKGDGRRLLLRGAQVVNGCQTLSTIWNYYKDASERQQKEMAENIKVFAKIIDHSVLKDDGLLDEIIIASNNQNVMNPRNLKSNSLEQRALQRSFFSDALREEHRYFYIRKDGEFESYLESGRRNPQRSQFRIEGSSRRGINRYRHIDNEQMAKVWWSWIGNSSKANVGSLKYFQSPLYSRVFEQHPSEDLLAQMRDARFAFFKEGLEAGSPSQYQLLTAMAVSSYISAVVKPREGLRKFKEGRIQHLRNEKKIEPGATSEQIAVALSNDNVYLFTIWKNQMSLGLTEIASFILTNRYGALDAQTCQQIMQLPDVTKWLSVNMDSAYLGDDAMTCEGCLMHKVMEFIDVALQRFFLANKNVILLQNRPKLYLSTRDNIVAIKEACIAANEEYVNYPYQGKPPAISFFDWLPDLR